MKTVCKLSSRCLAVIVTAVVACSSPQSFVGGDGGHGSDAAGDSGDPPTDGGRIDAASDGAGDPHTDAGVTDSGVTPDAPDSGDLVGMCGAVPTTTDEWERCRVKRLCENDVHCSEENLYTSVQECIDLRNAVSGGEIAFDTFERARAVAAGRASINVAAFTQCLNDLSPQRCFTAGSSPSCATRYTGTVADEQPCFNDAECISPGASCAPRDCGASCCMGTCTPRARLGQACHDFDACEPGLVCSVASEKCVNGDVGRTCADRLDCNPANWCDNGTCKPSLAEGAACDSLLQCGGETSCVGKFRHPPGEPPHCGHLTSAGDACDWFCLGNLHCDLSNPQGLGVCRSLPVLNEACSPFLPCIGQNVRCDDQGMCVPRAGLDEPCTDGTCLPGLFCTDQLGVAPPVCRAPFADNESGCRQNAQCQSQICTGNQTTVGQCLSAQLTCP